MSDSRGQQWALVLLAGLVSGCRAEKQVRADPSAMSAVPPLPSVPTPSPTVSSPVASSSALSLPTSLDAGAPGVDVDDPAARVAWVRAREAAVKGDDLATSELVRLPLVRRGPGWGCICPEYFIGTSSISGGDQTTWIAPVFAPTASSIPPDTVVIVEGYFTGKTTPFAPKTDEEFDKATLHELRVLRHRPVARDPNAEGLGVPPEEARMRVVLGASDAHRETEAPPDKRGFLLVALSAPMTEGPKAMATAERRRSELAAKGFADAEVIDTRTAPGLFCCHFVVVVSRHATASDADLAAKEAKKKGVAVLVRRAW